MSPDAPVLGTVLALDIGATKIAAGVVDAEGNLLVSTQRLTRGDTEELFNSVEELLREVGAGYQPLALGVGCAGPMRWRDETLVVSPLNIAAWRDFPLGDRLKAAIDLPLLVDGDAKCLALGEGWTGIAQGTNNFLAMVVSSGVGGGLVLNGRLLHGESHNGGHIGHVIVVPNGRKCACGARGCLEAEVSGLAIEEFTGSPAREASVAVREHVGTLVGRAVGSIANLLDLRLACVAGSVALGFGEIFLSAAQTELDRVTQIEFSRGSSIVFCRTDPLVGAGALAWQAAGHEKGPAA